MSGEAVPTAVSASGTSALSFRILESPFRLHLVSEQITDLLDTNKHVVDQLREAKRLLHLKESLLDPAERNWADRAIADAEASSRAVAALLERGRVDYETRNKVIGLRTRMAWVFRDRRRATDKRLLLLACQNSLLTAISHLHARNQAVASPISSATISGCEKEMDDQNEGHSLSEYEMGQMLEWRRSKQITPTDASLSRVSSPRYAGILEMP